MAVVDENRRCGEMERQAARGRGLLWAMYRALRGDEDEDEDAALRMREDRPSFLRRREEFMSYDEK